VDEFLTVQEVADELKLNQQTVCNWIVNGTLPATRVGRRVRVTREALDQIVKGDDDRDGTTSRKKPSAIVIGPPSARVVDARSSLAWTAFAQAMAQATSSLPAGDRGEIALAFETLATAAHGVADAISRLPDD
jgi:excisionase family DNA binding protein